MTDTGQVPGEGLPESAGMVEQPGVPAPGAYTYLSETAAEDEDLLLPGAQSAWGNEVPPPAPEPVVQVVHEPAAPEPVAPEPVAHEQVVHEPGPHEMSGRDSGSLDLGAVRATVATPVPQPPVARRPLHLGPLTPDASASPVRSLADRGPAGAPVPPGAVRQSAPATAGPEYLDVPQQSVSPWADATAPAVSVGGAAAETVVPQEQFSVAVAEAPQVAAVPQEAEGLQQVQDADALHQAQDAAFAQAQEAAAAQVWVPEPAEVPVAAQPQVPEAVPVPPVPEAVEVPPVAEVPRADPPQAPQAPEPVAAAPEGAVPTAPAAQVPDAAPFPPAAQGPEPVQVQAVAEAQDVFQAPQEPEAPAEPAEVSVPPQATAVEPPPQVDVTVPAAEVDASEQAAAMAEQQAAAVVPDAVQEPALVQDQPQPVETPVAQEPQQAEAASPQPEVVAEEPQAAEPVVPVADEAEQELDQEQAQAQPTEAVEAPAEPETDQQPAIAAEVEVEAEATPDSVAEPEVTDVNAADATHVTDVPDAMEATDQPQEVPDPQEPVLAEPLPAEAPADPVEPAAAAPAIVEPPAAEPPAPEVSQLDAPQGAVVQTPAEPTPEAPLAEAPQEPQPEPQPEAEQPQPEADQSLGQFVPVDGSVPTTPHLAPTPPQGMAVPPLPAEDRPTSVAAEFPAAEGQTEAAREAPEPEAAAEPVAEVPAPRASEAETIVVPQPVAAAGADPDVAQSAEDLDTRAADQEDNEEEAAAAVATEESTAVVEEAPTEAEAEAEVREEIRQPMGPAAPPYDDAEREAVLKVMRERRDIRNGFRSDPIPHDVLLRVLEAAHTAPSVGHSQPWDFVVIRSAETRRTMHELAQRQREAYAKSLPKGRAKQFKELKIEAILDTPVNIVVTADPTRGGRHTLGRHTQPQMAPYSSALAVENLWLAARAEGLGVGWVSFFDEREMVRALGLPEHLEVVAYLCVGYVDEFPAEPELMQAGWAKRRPLSWVVHEETYGRRALPGAEPHDLLAETVAGIRPLDAKALGEAWERQKRMTKPAGALGMLEIISAQLSGLSRQCPPPIPEPAAVAIFAGDHGVHAQGVTPWPQEVTAQMVANFLGGGAVCNAFATQVGAEVCVVDVGVASDLPATPGLLPRKIRAGTSDMTTGPAMTREEAKQAIEVGIETARDLVAAGNKALLTGEMGIANTTASAALIAVFTGADPTEVTGRGTGINDETLARKTEVVRRAIELHQPDPADPIGVLAAIGGFEHAAIVGLLLGGASLRTPVILDGVSAGAAALVARAIAPEVLAACIAGHRSAEPGHVAALQKLGLRPLVDLDLRLGEGTGALLALPVVQSAARAMHEVATFDSAGVTEK
ncbi:nicotinate-nucleotide--dimethylbenzimidazole phosphoribosyltransferase [Streptomyces adelaidensis]|uniref:nicotinate-nucleotide--dimethylbenzimidazole phosphoribosyltransferase n=1 Tax=Streptomyces adelaidensis TaxID=2796465 RepID=UPI00190615ED|nr:nicotinate-nucleotide--dimethylbenzimidazole phosphoribosyltransferase [Streptomyces adelaidensis]